MVRRRPYGSSRDFKSFESCAPQSHVIFIVPARTALIISYHVISLVRTVDRELERRAMGAMFKLRFESRRSELRSEEPVILGVVSRHWSERSRWIATYQIVSRLNTVLHGPN